MRPSSRGNEEKRKGDLLITNREALLKGGDIAPAVVPGKPDESFLIETLAEDADPVGVIDEETGLPMKKSKLAELQNAQQAPGESGEPTESSSDGETTPEPETETPPSTGTDS